MRPKLKFKIDHKKDTKTFFGFLKDAQYANGMILERAILKKYPLFKKHMFKGKLKISNSEIEEFVKDIYRNKKEIMRRNMILYQKNWEKIERDFYSLTDKLFPGEF